MSFGEVAGVLEKFICGLSGRELKLEAGDVFFTDTKRLFLPAVITQFKKQSDNYSLYKSMATQLWAQTWYGGPCPPIGQHRFFHKLYALDCILKGMNKPDKAEVELVHELV